MNPPARGLTAGRAEAAVRDPGRAAMKVEGKGADKARVMSIDRNGAHLAAE